MKITIPTDNNNLESSVCISFGRAPYFVIFDTENRSSKGIANAAAETTGGAGIKAAQTLVDSGTDILLTPRCGENAAEVLKAAGIKIYKTIEGTAEKNVEDYLAGKLSVLGEIHEGFHGKGGK